MKTIIVLLATFVGFSAFAKTYTGHYDDQTPCSISIQKTSATTSVVELKDARKVLRYQAQIVNRTHLGMNGGKVALTVTSFTEAVKTPMVVAQSFTNGNVKTCTAPL